MTGPASMPPKDLRYTDWGTLKLLFKEPKQCAPIDVNS